MQTLHRLSLILIVFVSASCVQLASDATAPAQVGNATFTAIPTETPIPPTEPPVIATEEVVEAQAAEATEEVSVLLEPTDPPLLGTTPTAIPTLTPSSTATPTATATATNTATPLPSPTEAVSGLVGEGTAIAQDDTPPLGDPGEQPGQETGQITEFEQTATALIVDATEQQAILLTETAIAAGIGQPTNTPQPDLQPTTDPGLQPGDPNQPGAATQPPANIVPGQDCIHEVRAQDGNLYRLSLAYGVPVMDIARASGIVNPNIISIGQRLTIPGCGTTGGIPPATSTPGPNQGGTGGGTGGVTPPGGDCSWGTTVQFPNGCPTGGGGTGSGNVGSGGTGTGGPSAGGIIHVVQQGETLFEISLRYGVPVATIAAANGISNYDRIDLNQQLVIP